ncbi:hypothetical protein OGAPHI_007145 [Ogataea philodendri]|uniref:Uncharacterized protein n=1 Tax=Ogataea philodendri TaxID=1378263 RepID=A0A9P8SZX1_9ASCO|nr:uncharacterized protein OGAPHI_007145 [Ogataea philodendri]KAH3660559.1 hypothetical protein OGAPHI_007145 [Ogataea philodendri]
MFSQQHKSVLHRCRSPSVLFEVVAKEPDHLLLFWVAVRRSPKTNKNVSFMKSQEMQRANTRVFVSSRVLGLEKLCPGHSLHDFCQFRVLDPVRQSVPGEFWSPDLAPTVLVDDVEQQVLVVAMKSKRDVAHAN